MTQENITIGTLMPLKHKRDVILELYSSPDAILNALHQAGWTVVTKHELTETAAERDRLKGQAREFAELAVKAERERDQAREQVKTLLAALKRLYAMDSPDYGRKLIAGEIADVAKAAIAAVESEDQ